MPEHKQRRDADVARKAILTAAEELFAEQGYAGTRVDEIAEKAGKNKALIFHYFGDKLGLYQAIVCSMKDDLNCLFAQYVASLPHDDGELTRDHVRAFLASAARSSFDYFLSRPRLLRIFAWEAAAGWQDFARFPPPPTAHHHTQEIVQFLRRAQEQGLVRADLDPVMLMTQCMSMTQMYLLSLSRFERIFPGVDFTSETALTHAREQMVSLLLHGTLTDCEK